MQSRDILVLLFALTFIGILFILIPKESSHRKYELSRSSPLKPKGGKNSIVERSRGIVYDSNGDVIFYGSLTGSYYGGGKAVIYINDGKPINAYDVSEKPFYVDATTGGKGFSVHWSSLVIKKGDRVKIAVALSMPDGSIETTSIAFTVPVISVGRATTLWGYNPVTKGYVYSYGPYHS